MLLIVVGVFIIISVILLRLLTRVMDVVVMASAAMAIVFAPLVTGVNFVLFQSQHKSRYVLMSAPVMESAS